MTTLVKHNSNLRKSLLDLFFSDSVFNPIFEPTSPMNNVSETENGYVLEMALPGMDKQDIHIEVDGEYLNISSKSETKEDNHWSYQTFSKRMYLGENIDKSNISSKMDNGILSIDIPKISEEMKPKRLIEIA